MRKRVDINTIEVIERNIRWANALSLTVDQLAEQGAISKVARKITRGVNRDHRLATILLCLGAIRFKEIQCIDLGAILSDRVQVIEQPKTKTSRLLSNLYLTNRASRATLTADTKKTISSYDALRLQILDSTPSKIRTILKFQNDKTHIFRHLRASFMNWRGIDIPEISEYFAHQSEQATREYINTGLFEIFNKTQ